MQYMIKVAFQIVGKHCFLTKWSCDIGICAEKVNLNSYLTLYRK